MARNATDLLDEALDLPAQDRARLAGELLRSLDDADEVLDQQAYDAAWGAVIERRLREIDTGAVQAVPWSEARRRIVGGE